MRAREKTITILLCYSFDAVTLNWTYLANPGQIDPTIPQIFERNQCIFTGEIEIILML